MVTGRAGMGMACRWALMLAAAFCAFVVMTALLRWLAPAGQPVSWMHAPSVYAWVMPPADGVPPVPAVPQTVISDPHTNGPR
jgi:hypothetical protein